MTTIQDLYALLSMQGGGMAPNANYMGQQENAYQTFVQSLLANMNSENAVRSAFEKQQGFLQDDEVVQRRRLIDALANRGMLHSSPAIRGQNEIAQGFTRNLDSLVGSRDTSLADLASQRINAQGAYGQTVAGIQNSMANQASQDQTRAFLAEAERRRNEQEMAVNSQNQARDDAFKAQMISLYSPQQPTPVTPVTPAAPVIPKPPTVTTSTIPQQPARFPSLSPTGQKAKQYNIKPGLGYN